MTRFYVRVEGVNLSNFVYETQDLSTIRGGSLLLLEAVGAVEDWLRSKCGRVDPISTGASSGLFDCEADGMTAEEVCGFVRGELGKHPDFRHATIAVDALAAGEGKSFESIREQTAALNRWRQMTAPRVAVPAHNDDPSIRPCEVDLVRPATGAVEKKETDPQTGAARRVTLKTSLSVQQRCRYGRAKKQKFIRGEFDRHSISEQVKHKFAWDLDALTRDDDNKLHHKMAVIYIDGNGFGRIQKECCATAAGQKSFDAYIKGGRVKWLEHVVAAMNQDPSWVLRAEDGEEVYRLEILQWGGDESCWVVPAWKGWELLSLLFEKSSGWVFEGRRLEHAAGIVFCHHNAPIHRVKDLAYQLADEAKVARDRSLLAYEILESFDHVGRNLAGFRKERCPRPDDPAGGPDTSVLLLRGRGMKEVAAAMAEMKKIMPRRKLVRIVRGLLAGPEELTAGGVTPHAARPRPGDLMAEVDAEVCRTPGGKAARDTLAGHFNGERAWWIHLNALWDYVG